MARGLGQSPGILPSLKDAASITLKERRAMKLTFYKTGFTPQQNGVYEDVLKHLASLKPVLTIEDFKFIQPTLQTTIKLDLSGKQFDSKEVGDYVCAEDGTSTWLYFVMNCKWRAKQTLELEIALDTLNTYWSDVEGNFSPQTHVTRRYKSRFVKSADSLVPKVDNIAETISIPPQIRVKSKAFDPKGDFYSGWHLVYKTDYEDVDELKENPITLLAIPNATQKIATQNVGDVELTVGSLRSDSWIVLDTGSTIKFGSNTWNSSEHFLIYVGRKEDDDENLYVGLVYDGAVSAIGPYVNVAKVSTATLTKCYQYFNQTSSCPEFADTGGTISKITYQDYVQKVSTQIRYDSNYIVKAGAAYSELPSFDDWYNAHATDATVVKILSTPYPPFTLYTDSSGNLNLPDGWEFTVNGLKLVDKSKELKCSLGQITRYLPLDFTKDDVDVTKSYDLKFETKLYNSSYITSKLVYDTAVWTDKPENAKDDYSRNAQLSVDFNLSTSMDGTVLFTINNQTNQTEDFGESLISTRTLEVPYFTNEYLNYLRYGKAVDERNRGLSVASSIVGAIGTGTSLAATAAMGFSSGPVGAAIGFAVGALTAIVSTTTSIFKANDQINSKIDQYTHQASKANATSDISIFEKYGKNRLLNIVYEPIPQLKNSIGNFFRLYGYSADDYGVPDFNTRYWSDYLVVEPVFKDSLVWNEFKDDISERMKLGFRVYHRHNGYDLDCEKENWENELVSWN